MGALEMLGQIMAQCWRFLDETEFTVSGITFTLANVLEVSVICAIGGLLISIFIVAGGGDFDD